MRDLEKPGAPHRKKRERKQSYPDFMGEVPSQAPSWFTEAETRRRAEREDEISRTQELLRLQNNQSLLLDEIMRALNIERKESSMMAKEFRGFRSETRHALNNQSLVQDLQQERLDATESKQAEHAEHLQSLDDRIAGIESELAQLRNDMTSDT
jgi:hypothetical protein